MTAKEKAIELIDIFCEYTNDSDKYEYAKKCALIAVDEIINTHQWGGGIAFDEKQFWEEVKHEIEKL